MFLAIDIGNTCITLGIYSENILVDTVRISTNINLGIEDYINLFNKKIGKFDIKHCMISSVVKELTTIVNSAIDNVFNINAKILNTSLNLGITINTKNPNEVGADRIANSAYAYHCYKNTTIVIDSGSATTFDIINHNGCFIGGLIMPGLNLQFDSLNNKTSLLPLIEPGPINKVIANDTVNSILSGVVRGHACSIDGLIEQCKIELEDKTPILIGTGGNIELLRKYIHNEFNAIIPSLTLNGIKLIYDLNFN